MNKIITICLCLLTGSITHAQTVTQTSQENQLWLGYFNQIRVTDKWGLWLDLHYRTTNHYINDASKALGRVALTYYLTDDIKLSNGYEYTNHFPDEGHANISQPEHRIWQQVQYHGRLSKAKTMSWVRLEERFRHRLKNDNELGEGYKFDIRLRSNFLVSVPLSKRGFAPNTLAAVASDEIFINFPTADTRGTYFPFDQNRFFVGLAYYFTKSSYIQAGYSNVYQQVVADTKFKNIDVIRLFYFQNLDLRKKK